MADAKLTALTEAVTAADTDLVYLVVDPAGTPASRKITVENLLDGAPQGDVVGPGVSVDKEVALFDGTDGDTLERATGTGVARVTNGVWGTPGNVVESEITLVDNTTNNVSTTKHGFAPKAPNDAAQYLDGTGAYSVPAGSGGGSTSTAAYASRPAAGNAGNLFLPSDGHYIERDTGAAWASWGPIYPCVRPTVASFAWENQGGATGTDTNGGIFMSMSNPGALALRALVQTLPATPYTVTIGMKPQLMGLDYCGAGIALFESGSGKFATLSIVGSASGMLLAGGRWTNATSAVANAFAVRFDQGNCMVWLRITDNGTNRLFYVSPDGYNWVQYFSETNTSHCTPDKVGINLYSATIGYGTAAIFPSFSVT
jgi:hypothetical protein